MFYVKASARPGVFRAQISAGNSGHFAAVATTQPHDLSGARSCNGAKSNKASELLARYVYGPTSKGYEAGMNLIKVKLGLNQVWGMIGLHQKLPFWCQAQGVSRVAGLFLLVCT